jgi:anti-sigma factor RsiW
MMMDADCRAIRDDIDAFVDDELTGVERLRVSQHLERCSACAEEVQAAGELGALLRHGAAAGLANRRIDGLASGVVSLSRALWAESWRGLVDRAFGNWHWAIVGIGSVAATFVSTMFVSLILEFGPVPQRDDSLSAVMASRVAPAGLLFVYATAPVEIEDPVPLQFNHSELAPSSRAGHPPPTRRPGGPRTTAELVGDLTAALARQGHIVAVDRLTPRDRRHAEELLTEISRRLVPDSRPFGGAVRVEQVRLITSTSVSARARGL